MATIDDTLAALRSNFDGDPWHGSALRTIISGVDPAMVHAHPIAKAKSIAELLAHATAWIEIVERRVRGEEFKITTAMDFPDTTNVAWPHLLARVDAAQARLIQTVSGLEEPDLARTVSASRPHSVRVMLSGLMHHNTYHAAQIALLSKA
ncbi:MAG: DinB family protein [Thermoanaerobaculia bacterium]